MPDLHHLLPTFISIPAVRFRMGTPERDLSALAKAYGGTRESYREESPQHSVTLPPYAIAATPVTNALYAAFVAATAAPPPLAWHGTAPPADRRDHPVVDISWHDARAFCQWLSEIANCRLQIADYDQSQSTMFRLPTEAEWEHAARDSDGRAFPWGDTWDGARANTRESGPGSTTPVGAHPDGASLYGCLDMAGNVWEWTSTLDALYPYDAADGRADAEASGRRILRGGCYANPHGFARCACRFRMPPAVRNEFLGFRLVYTT